jgi:putative membrane protein
MATMRTVMAADRTLMAWIRTALSMISFGFTIFKFLHGLTESATIHLLRPEGPRNLGLFLTLLGTGSLVASTIQYAFVLRQLGVSALKTGVTFYVSCAVVALGLAVLVAIAYRAGPF